VKYKAGHSYQHTYEKCELFCPECGVQQVWQEQSEGDYYVGETYVCLGCEVQFTIQGPTLISGSDESVKQILSALRSAAQSRG